MRISIKDYYEKTPPLMRKIGDSLGLACGAGAIAAANYNVPKIAGWCVGGIILSKFLTNCFSDDKNDK